MKRFSLFLMFVLSVFPLLAQEIDTDVKVQEVYQACIAMRDAASAKDTAAINQSAKLLTACQTKEFAALRSKQEQESLDGHLVFDEEFAKQLAEGKDAYQQSDSICDTRAERGQTANGSILTKTCFAKAGKSVKYTFPSKNKQILAVVANRKTTFMLPGDCVNIVELEVVNCSKKDISFVVISN